MWKVPFLRFPPGVLSFFGMGGFSLDVGSLLPPAYLQEVWLAPRHFLGSAVAATLPICLGLRRAHTAYDPQSVLWRPRARGRVLARCRPVGRARSRRDVTAANPPGRSGPCRIKEWRNWMGNEELASCTLTCCTISDLCHISALSASCLFWRRRVG